MSANDFLLFVAFGLFSVLNMYSNLKTGSPLIKRQSYLLLGIGLCGMLYLLIINLV